MKTRGLRLLVMHVSTRCDQACAHCSIWSSKQAGRDALGVDERVAVIRAARTLGARAILFTGGEPLLCDHLERLVRAARESRLSVQIATNGLGLAGSAPWLADLVDEVYVSLEGPEAIHDEVRGRGMFARLQSSVEILTARRRRPRLIGRAVVSALNAGVLDETVKTARRLGLDGLSFLAMDATSDAFGGHAPGRQALRPSPSDGRAMRRAISRLQESGELGGFVAESPGKLTEMADRFERGGSELGAPRCNAPEWSSVVDADGAIRPCFFQPKIAVDRDASLGEVRRSPEYATALKKLGDDNSICVACVCPKYLTRGLAGLADRVTHAVTFGWTASGRKARKVA